MLTRERLKQLLLYDPDTGSWTWIQSTSNRVKVGSRAGTINDNGYRIIHIDRRGYRSGRLAFLFVSGRFPENDVDHRDGLRSNDRWANLREATRSENLWNEGLSRRNTSGIKGVSYHSSRRKWSAQICYKGRNITLGRFPTKEEAIAARRSADQRLYGDFARAIP